MLRHPSGRRFCELQVGLVFDDCVRTLRTGRAITVEEAESSARWTTDHRIGLIIEQPEMAQASAILFETVATALREVIGTDSNSATLRSEALLTLYRSVQARWQLHTRHHDSLLDAVHKVAEAKRRTLARDVHDRVGNNISLAMRQLELHALTLTDGAEQEHERDPSLVLSARDTLVSTLLQLRELITWLHDSRIDGNLSAATEAFVAAMQMPDVDLDVEVNGDESVAGPEILDELFLVLRECLLNALVHGEAGRLVVRVEFTDDQVTCSIQDDGIGFDIYEAQAARRGHGLISMADRVDQLGGRFELTSRPGSGTRVSLWIPIPGDPRDV
ncbi:sensor histidine kinase [Streptomyces sp. NBC_01304]|uniref:sensor histidine kinase n=1 Tax=Streptomyces sp. NBC_01304 TaxID=2903818 RepID=UPI002E0DA3B8|nr:ATP-binding protein [Streptomyces sp. NBC_01304]